MLVLGSVAVWGPSVVAGHWLPWAPRGGWPIFVDLAMQFEHCLDESVTLCWGGSAGHLGKPFYPRHFSLLFPFFMAISVKVSKAQLALLPLLRRAVLPSAKPARTLAAWAC